MAAVFAGETSGRVSSTVAVQPATGLCVIVMLPVNSAEEDACLGVELCPSPAVDTFTPIHESPRDSSDPLAAVPTGGTAVIAAVCFGGDQSKLAKWALPVCWLELAPITGVVLRLVELSPTRVAFPVPPDH